MEILRGRELDAKIAKFEGWVWVYKLQESQATLMDEDEAVYATAYCNAYLKMLGE